MFIKDPYAVLPYIVDWTAWMPEGDSIASVTWVPSTGITVEGQANTNYTATVTLSGGTAGQNYTVACEITTAGGLQDSRQLEIDCSHR